MSNFGTRNSGFFGGATGGGVGTLQQVTDLGASSTNSLNLTGNNGIYCDSVANLYKLGNNNNFGGSTGLSIDAASTVIKIGDYGNNVWLTYLSVDYSTTSTKVSTYYNFNENGLRIDFFNQSYYIGDFFGGTAFLQCNAGSGEVYIQTQNYIDLFCSGNNTRLLIDDYTLSISFFSGNGKYKFNAVPTYATNALAVAGGLVTGNIYKSAAGVLSIVL